MNIIDKSKIPTLRGVVISDSHGIQAVQTESREQGKQIIHCLGVTRIPHATVGDNVRLWYRIVQNGGSIAGMWFGRKVS
jgi:hypothetical protein